MEKASPLVVAETAGAALFFVAVPAFWLLMRRDELESSGMFLLAGGLIASIAWGVILWTVSGRK